MSEAPEGLNTSVEHKKVIPDYFGYYIREVADLLSQSNEFLHLSSQTCQNSEIARKMQGTVREEDITKHNCNGKYDNILVDSGSLFCDAVGDGVSDIMKERLKALLRQTVVALTGEVDEMLDPVLGIRRIQLCLSVKKTSSSCVGATTEGDAAQHHHKKLKLPSSSCSVSLPLDASPTRCSFSGEGKGNEDMDVTGPEKGISNLVKKQCDHCHTIKTPMWRNGPEGTKLCNACGLRFKKGKESLQINDPKAESFLDSKIEVEKENEEANDDLQFLLENNDSTVVKTMKKYSDELSTTEHLVNIEGYDGNLQLNFGSMLSFQLEHMEQKLEELLDTVMSTCRSLKHAEKIQLRKSIENLPPRNLDRVMEIIGRRKRTEKYSCDEIHVDLENEDNITLWRLYFYVKTVENARELFELN